MKNRILAAVALPVVGLAATALPSVAAPVATDGSPKDVGRACFDDAQLCVRTNVPGAKVEKKNSEHGPSIEIGNDRLQATSLDESSAGNLGECVRGQSTIWIQEAKVTEYDRNDKQPGLDAPQVLAVKAIEESKGRYQAVVALTADPGAGRVGQKLDKCDAPGVHVVLTPGNRMVTNATSFKVVDSEEQARADLNAEQAEKAFEVLATAHNQ